jgi:Tfp pilus assembly protein PilF
MKVLLALVALLLAGCATAPAGPPPAPLFADARFAPPSQRIDADAVFALDDAMRRYVEHDMAPYRRAKGDQRGLVDALYRKGWLKLEYDSAMTRTASEAFAARSGNCLSLVIMTAAFAKHLGLPVIYQSVLVPETWSRSGNLYFSSGHVNVSIGKKQTEAHTLFDLAHVLTIDFLPPADLRGQYTTTLSEATIVGMYMNNRAAESLAQGKVDDAYWWARAAIESAPTFTAAHNTLAVIYTTHGDLAQAEQVLQRLLAREPANVQAMANLVPVLERQGRVEEAQALQQKLATLEPQPPFHFFNLGMAAMRAGDHQRALELFRQEIDRAAYYHEFHFWAALAELGLGDVRGARKHLAIALDNSTTRADRDLYSAKLEHLKTRLR